MMKLSGVAALGAVLMWLVTTASVVMLLPQPHERFDYFLGGVAGTLVGAFMVFVAFVRRNGIKNVFYKTRRRASQSNSSILGI